METTDYTILKQIADEIGFVYDIHTDKNENEWRIDFEKGAPDYGGCGNIDENEAEKEFDDLIDNKVKPIVAKYPVKIIGYGCHEKEMWYLTLAVKH